MRNEVRESRPKVVRRDPAAPAARASAWYRACQQVLQACAAGLFRVRVFGRENVPASGGAVIASNHQSYLDPVLVAVGLRRPVAFMAREGLFRPAAFAALIRSLNAFAVRRGAADAAAVREAIERLRRGALVLVFPEGTRTRDGAIGPIKGGAEILAQRAGVPVVPTAIDGAFEAWPRGRACFAPRTIWVAFGRPLAPPGCHGEERKAFRDRLSGRMRALHARLRRARTGRPERGTCRRSVAGERGEVSRW